MENQSPTFRLAPGKEVRLRHAYVIRCERVSRAPDGQFVVHCTHDPLTLGQHPVGRKVKGSFIGWLLSKRSRLR